MYMSISNHPEVKCRPTFDFAKMSPLVRTDYILMAGAHCRRSRRGPCKINCLVDEGRITFSYQFAHMCCIEQLQWIIPATDTYLDRHNIICDLADRPTHAGMGCIICWSTMWSHGLLHSCCDLCKKTHCTETDAHELRAWLIRDLLPRELVWAIICMLSRLSEKAK